MNKAKINALIATSYNVHFGNKEGRTMTPAEAGKLPRADRVALAYVLRERGGSDLFTKADADAAFVALVG